jgi:hypothetical protein
VNRRSPLARSRESLHQWHAIAAPAPTRVRRLYRTRETPRPRACSDHQGSPVPRESMTRNASSAEERWPA